MKNVLVHYTIRLFRFVPFFSSLLLSLSIHSSLQDSLRIIFTIDQFEVTQLLESICNMELLIQNGETKHGNSKIQRLNDTICSTVCKEELSFWMVEDLSLRNPAAKLQVLWTTRLNDWICLSVILQR